MISSLEDLHKWAVTLGTGALLPKSLQQERLRTHPLVTTPKVKIAYGLGITNLNGFLGHDGGILGYATAMFYLPKAKATIVVESNSDNVSAQSAPSGPSSASPRTCTRSSSRTACDRAARSVWGRQQGRSLQWLHRKELHAPDREFAQAPVRQFGR